MNNKRNISFSTTAAQSELKVAANGMASEVTEKLTVINTTRTDIIPNFDFDNNLFLDSSIQEDFKKVVKYRLSQKPVNLLSAITSDHTAISLAFNCPDETSQAVLIPEPTIFPQPVFEDWTSQDRGTDYHEIEFSLDELRCSGNQVHAGLEFDFFGNINTIGTTVNAQ